MVNNLSSFFLSTKIEIIVKSVKSWTHLRRENLRRQREASEASALESIPGTSSIPSEESLPVPSIQHCGKCKGKPTKALRILYIPIKGTPQISK